MQNTLNHVLLFQIKLKRTFLNDVYLTAVEYFTYHKKNERILKTFWNRRRTIQDYLRETMRREIDKMKIEIGGRYFRLLAAFRCSGRKDTVSGQLMKLK